MAKADLRSITELKGIFYIPSYQRGYRWTKAEMRALVSDLYHFAIEKNKPDGDYYCLQPIVVKPMGDGDDKWEVVDGQQRLTSLWILSQLYKYISGDNIFDYTLEFENKDDLTNLIANFGQTLSEAQFINEGILPPKNYVEKNQHDCMSLDAFNVLSNTQELLDMKINNNVWWQIIQSIFSNVLTDDGDIKIIWYVLDEAEDPIQMFTNLNANKIELTQSELIKAMMSHKLGSDKKNNADSPTIFSFAWEEIERGLQNDSFWHFMTGNRKLRTRIDYLFDIWYSGKETASSSDYPIFDLISTESKDADSAQTIWNEMQTIYETLMDWYNNNFFYHTIGLIISLSNELDPKKSSAEIIRELYDEFSDSEQKITRSEFRKKLRSRIRAFFIDNSKKSNLWKLDDNIDELDKSNSNEYLKYLRDSSLSYTNNAKGVKATLLLYNIAMLVNSENKHERFPFDLYKKQKWDLEHINPQTPQDGDDEKIAFLNGYLKLIEQTTSASNHNENDNSEIIPEESTLAEKINECLNDNLKDFENIVQNCERFVEKLANNLETTSDGSKERQSTEKFSNDHITNIVLLDCKTNREYHNAFFADKRSDIVRVVRNIKDIPAKDNTKGKVAALSSPRYLLPGTKWVFFKEYVNARQIVFWTQNDKENYLTDMADTIHTMFEGTNDGGNNDE